MSPPHLVHYIDDVRVLDGGEPVSDGDARPAHLISPPPYVFQCSAHSQRDSNPWISESLKKKERVGFMFGGCYSKDFVACLRSKNFG
jgi:hypothetical protein